MSLASSQNLFAKVASKQAVTQWLISGAFNHQLFFTSLYMPGTILGPNGIGTGPVSPGSPEVRMVASLFKIQDQPLQVLRDRLLFLLGTLRFQ